MDQNDPSIPVRTRPGSGHAFRLTSDQNDPKSQTADKLAAEYKNSRIEDEIGNRRGQRTDLKSEDQGELLATELPADLPEVAGKETRQIAAEYKNSRIKDGSK